MSLPNCGTAASQPSFRKDNDMTEPIQPGAERAGCCLDGITDQSPYRYAGGACDGCPRAAIQPSRRHTARPEASVRASAEPGKQRASGEPSKPSHSSAKAKRRHGDIAAAVRAMLANPATAPLSNAEIARRCQCNRPFVGTLRRKAPDLRPKIMPDDSYRLVTRLGRTFLMDVSAIGPRRAV